VRAGPAPSGGEAAVEGIGEALGRSLVENPPWLRLRAEGGGKPIAAVLTAGERHEQFALDALMDKGAVPRSGRGRPRLRPRRTAGDRGYSSPPARRRLRPRRIEPVIPTRKDQPLQPNFDKAAYRERNKVERLIGRLKRYRRIATRYEKRAANYLAMVTLGMTMLWLT
jgi:transposase